MLKIKFSNGWFYILKLTYFTSKFSSLKCLGKLLLEQMNSRKKEIE